MYKDLLFVTTFGVSQVLYMFDSTQ